MSKLPLESALTKVEAAIAEIDTITAIMVTLGKHAEEGDIQREWLEFFGRSIDDITQRIEDVLKRAGE